MKDPAVLIYKNDWLVSTAGMDADCRGWYFNLLLHNYDKKTLPDDIETLAAMAGVKFSEFDRFKHVFEHVLKHKFEHVSEHVLSNPRTSVQICSRENYIKKRSEAGKISYILKYFNQKYVGILEKKHGKLPKNFTAFLKLNVRRACDLETIDLKSEQVFKQVFEQVFELYINENVNKEEERKKGIQGEKGKQTSTSKKNIPPTLDEVKEYFSKNGYTKESAIQFFNYYEAGKWQDSKGNQVKNWKQKAIGVWFKDENKGTQLFDNKSIVDKYNESREKFSPRGG
jgi:hypothetical protein